MAVHHAEVGALPSRPVAAVPRARLRARSLWAALIGAGTSLFTLSSLPAAVPWWLRAALALLSGLAAYACVDLIYGQDGRQRVFSQSQRAPAPFQTRVAQWLRPVPLWAGLAGLVVLALVPVVGPGAALRVGLSGLLLLAPGYLAARLLVPAPVGSLSRLALSWALSAGLIPLPLALLNWAGVPFSLPVVLACLALLGTALALAARRVPAAGEQAALRAEPPPSASEQVLLGSALALTVLLAALPYLVGGSAFPFGRDYQHPVNVAHILGTGWPWPQPGYIHRTYPDSYGYLTAAVAALAGWTPLQVLKVLPVLSLVGGALALYGATRGLVGRRPAAFALLAYGALSYEPRTNFFFGTFIDLVTNLTFVPLYLWALTRTVEERGYRAPLLAGLLGGFLIQYHLLTTTLALAVSALFLLGLLVLRRTLLTAACVRRLGVLLGVALLSGLPFSLYYLQYYVTTGLTRLGLLHATLYDVTFPAAAFPWSLLRPGLCYLVLPLGAVLLLCTGRIPRHRPGPAMILLVAWCAVLLLGSFTRLFVDPIRSVYLLPLPGAILLGLMAQAARNQPRRSDTGRRPIGQRLGALTLLALIALTVAPGVAFVAGSVTRAIPGHRFAEARDLPSLVELQHIWQAEGEPHVLTDESGVWAHYFTDGQVYVLPGGPAAFGQWFPEDRVRYQAFWSALQAPCAPESLQTFQFYRVRFIYLGRRPQHEVKPGYEYNDGSRLLACPWYIATYTEETPEGTIRIFRVEGW